MKPVQAIFCRKPERIAPEQVKIEKVIHLPEFLYRHFLERPFAAYSFIKENGDQMYVDQAGQRHAILVMGEGHADGVLVESEGSSYARYASYMPHATVLAYSPLQELAEALSELTDFLARSNQDVRSDWFCRMDFENIERKSGIPFAENPALQALLKNMLIEREEVQEARLENGQLVLEYQKEFQPEIESFEQQLS